MKKRVLILYIFIGTVLGGAGGFGIALIIPKIITLSGLLGFALPLFSIFFFPLLGIGFGVT